MTNYLYVITYIIKGDPDSTALFVYINGTDVDSAVQNFRKEYSDETFSILGVARAIKRDFSNM